jgi:hypothetical protein
MSELNDNLLDEKNQTSKCDKFKPYFIALSVVAVIGFIIELVFISIKYFSTN